MQLLKSKRLMLLLVTFASIFVFGLTTSLAQEKVKVKSKAYAAITKSEKFKVDDTEGHFVILAENKGVTSDGKLVRYFTTKSDLIKGNGTHEGYGKYVDVNDGDFYFVKFEGKVITTKSPEGKFKTTFNGTYSYTTGTGKWANIEGGGTYMGGMLGKGIFYVEGDGEYVIKK